VSDGGEKTGHGVAGISNHVVTLTDSEREVIRKQLNRILGSFAIRTSKKCSDFLRYVVEEALAGRSDGLKERTLGIEVFHRGPLYDTNTDPVVRVTAGEVRKRLAQYYDQPSHQREIRIELPRGSYVPAFHHPEDIPLTSNPDGLPAAESLPGSGAEADEQLTIPIGQPGRTAPKGVIGRLFGLSLALIAGLLLGAFVVHSRGLGTRPPVQSTALDQFWAPVVNSPGPVWLCIGQVYANQITLQPNGSIDPFDTPYVVRADATTPHPVVVLADSATLARVTGFLQSRNKNFTIHGESETNLSDLTNGASVLIGAFNNDWTIRLNDSLRFHFEMNPATRAEWIVDRDNPGKKIGTHIPGPWGGNVETAYAIISRVRDASTGQMVISIGGISSYGTLAAGNFVSDPTYMKQFAGHEPSDWASKNLQLLIAADVVNGSLGEPRVVKSYSW
jgi:hypothetical protein